VLEGAEMTRPPANLAVLADRAQEMPIGGERETVQGPCVALEAADLLAREHGPDLDRAHGAAREDVASRGREGDSTDRGTMALQLEERLLVEDVVDLEAAIPEAVDDDLALWVHGHAADRTGKAMERVDLLASGRVPEGDGAVPRCRSDRRVVEDARKGAHTTRVAAQLDRDALLCYVPHFQAAVSTANSKARSIQKGESGHGLSVSTQRRLFLAARRRKDAARSLLAKNQ